jgi:hypothetical protein
MGPTGWAARITFMGMVAMAPLGFALFASCSDDAEVAAEGSSNASGAGGQGASSNTYSSGVGPAPEFEAPCGNKMYECGDLVDNDMDMLLDSQDPDCLGPCDNTEDSYYTDIPGMEGGPCKADCFWDNGNGSGTDDCYWDHKCDPLEVDPDYPPEGPDCAYDENAMAGPYTCDEAYNMQSQTCYDVCLPLVPNGCDCFGCCELPAGSSKFVWLGSTNLETNAGTCTIDVVEDTDLCKPCTPVPGCGNDCAPCELCLGKTELPPECFDPDGGNPGQCEGLQACGLEGQDPCPQGYYCITGCCIEIVQ